MLGYWEDPERTEQTIDPEGWLHSGDLGEMDAEGYVKITGRIKGHDYSRRRKRLPTRNRRILIQPP